MARNRSRERIKTGTRTLIFVFSTLVILMSCSSGKPKKVSQRFPSFPGYLEKLCTVILTQEDIMKLSRDKKYQILNVKSLPYYKGWLCEREDYMLIKPPDGCFCLKEMT